MEALKNLVVSIAGIAIILFVLDSTATKYNLNPEEPTCINSGVEDLLIQVATEDSKKQMLKMGYILNVNVIKEKTTTESRDFTYRGMSKYSCNTSLEFSLGAVSENKNTEKMINAIPKDDLIKTKDIDYTITRNDMETTYYVSAYKTTEDTLKELYEDEFNAAKEKIAEEERAKKKAKLEGQKKECIAKYEKLGNRYSYLVSDAMSEREDSERLDELKKLRVQLEKLENECPIIVEGYIEEHGLRVSSKGFKNNIDIAISNYSREEKSLETVAEDVKYNDMSLSKNAMGDVVKLSTENETCSMEFWGIGTDVEKTNCLNIQNSKGIQIFCTPQKTLCKTFAEVSYFRISKGKFLPRKITRDKLPAMQKGFFNFLGGNGTESWFRFKDNNGLVEFGGRSFVEYSGQYNSNKNPYVIIGDVICNMPKGNVEECTSIY